MIQWNVTELYSHTGTGSTNQLGDLTGVSDPANQTGTSDTSSASDVAGTNIPHGPNELDGLTGVAGVNEPMNEPAKMIPSHLVWFSKNIWIMWNRKEMGTILNFLL